MATFDTLGHYILSVANSAERIARIDAVIEQLEETAILAAASGHIDEYNLDDGQTKIRTIYRNVKDIAIAIDNFQKIKTRLINKVSGRTFVLRNAKELKGYGSF